MKKKIIIISGDPISINSEIIFKSWKKISKNLKKKIFIISNYKLLNEQFKKLNYNINLVKVNSLDLELKSLNGNELKIIDVDLKFKSAFKADRNLSSKFVINCLNLAHKLALSNNVAGIINCSIDKKLLNKSNIGVTEFLSNKCNLKDNSEIMLIKGEKISVCPITTHINVNEVSKRLSKKLIWTKITTINHDYKKYFKKKPKIAILGLNPHNAELRNNSEEKKIIIPAIKKISRKGINVHGPFSADTFFMSSYKKYDVVVGMYHDQVITPIKTIEGFEAINITFGLKYLRASPDHGTAVDLIGRNKANPKSLINCINLINKINNEIS